jgi:hypothetical protein
MSTTNMNLLGNVKGISCDLDGFARHVELGILVQLAVHSPTIVKGTSNGGVVACIYCMVSTMEFFNFLFASHFVVVLFFLGS